MNKKPTIFLDFDGTLVDSISSICKLYNKDFRYYEDFCPVLPTQIQTYDFSECTCASKEIIHTYFQTPRFFNSLKFMPGAVGALRFIKNDFNINIVSHGFQANLLAKRLWIEKHIPHATFTGIDLSQTKDKSCVDMSGSIFVDDMVSNLDSSNAKHKIIFGKTYPWNEDEHGYTRCKDWIDLGREIIKLSY